MTEILYCTNNNQLEWYLHCYVKAVVIYSREYSIIKLIKDKIKLRMKMGNVSKRQQPDQRVNTQPTGTNVSADSSNWVFLVSKCHYSCQINHALYFVIRNTIIKIPLGTDIIMEI